MALAELLVALERDTEARIREIRAAGDAEARQIAEGGAHTRADRIAAALAAFTRERRASADLALAEASRRARAELLTTRAAMLDRLRDAVSAELPGLVAGEPQLGDALVAAALACCGDEPGTLRCAPALAARAAATTPTAIRVEPDPGVTTGAVVELATGTRVEATLAALLEREWPRLSCEALAMERTG